MPDYDRLRYDELASISELLHGLSDEQWDHESLCTGWRVRHVVSHMTLGYTTPMLTMMAKVGRHGFNVPKASAEESVEFGNSAHAHRDPGHVRHDPERPRAQRHLEAHPDEGSAARPRRAPAGHAPTARAPADGSRRPTRGRARPSRPGLGGFVKSKQRAAGLRFTATDITWTHGDGPEVQGPGEALLLALAGRPVALDELTGDGVDTLRSRVAS